MKVFKGISLFLLMLIFIAGCDLGQPRDCEVNTGNTVDEELFSTYFSSMRLMDETGFEGVSHDEDEAIFAPASPLSISFDAIKDGSIVLCIQSRTGSKFTPATLHETFEAGSSTINISNYMNGSYVVRVIVEDTLVKNLPFGTD